MVVSFRFGFFFRARWQWLVRVRCARWRGARVGMSCRRKGASPSSSTPAVAADVDDRQLSEAGRARAKMKSAGSAQATAAVAPIPWAMVFVGLSVVGGMLYLTIKY